jgi:hypothetical protein
MHVQSAVEQGDPVADQSIGGVLCLGRLIEPLDGVLLGVERGERPHRGGTGEGKGRWLGVRLRLARPSAPPRRGGGRPERLHHENVLAILVSGQVAPVREEERTGKVELRESE